MQIKVSDLQFSTFFIDKSMFSLQICRYLMGKLMIEVYGEKVSNLLNLTVPGKPDLLEFGKKSLPGGQGFDDFVFFWKFCPGGW